MKKVRNKKTVIKTRKKVAHLKTQRPKIDLEATIQKMVRWLKSPAGRRVLKKAYEETERANERFRKSCEVDPRTLRWPMTI